MDYSPMEARSRAFCCGLSRPNARAFAAVWHHEHVWHSGETTVRYETGSLELMCFGHCCYLLLVPVSHPGSNNAATSLASVSFTATASISASSISVTTSASESSAA